MIKLVRLVSERGVVRGTELEILRKNGARKWVRMNMRAIRDDGGNIVLREGTVEDINEHKAAQERMRFLAYYDALTELPHRALLQDRLENALTGARRTGREGSAAISRSGPVQVHQ